MAFKTGVYRLLSKFLEKYPENKYPEIMQKPARPYCCLMIETKFGFLICIPFRSNINHKEAFFFHKTKRSKLTKSGLDYSKMVLITEESYIDNEPAIVDTDEHRETMKHLSLITSESLAYIERYMEIAADKSKFKEFERRYKYSTLRYFEDILKAKN